MSFNPVIFIAENEGLSLLKALQKAYDQGRGDRAVGNWIVKKNEIICPSCHTRYKVSAGQYQGSYCLKCGARIGVEDGKNI